MDRYASPGAYRRALEDRLRSRAIETAVPLQRLRTRLAMERFLARLFAGGDEPWLLKGGYALELLLAPRARTTRDIDLNLEQESGPPDWSRVRDHLQQCASADLSDGFTFEIGRAGEELQGAPLGGARYSVEALVASREFVRFRVDVGAGDPVTGDARTIDGLDLLDFAGIPPARVRMVPLSQLFAEKLHAYTRPWVDRENTRVKDLVDLLLLIDAGLEESPDLEHAVERTFSARATHPVPADLPPPPESWETEYDASAANLDLPDSNLTSAYTRLAGCWKRIRTRT